MGPKSVNVNYFSSKANPFYSNGERTWNDEHPVLGVLTFCTIFASGVLSFHALRTVYETVTSSASMSMEFNDISGVDVCSFDGEE